MDKLITKALDAGRFNADEIAERTGVHKSSVYMRRKRLENESDEGATAAGSTAEPQGMPKRAYMEYQHANDALWIEIWDERREPSDAELLWVLAHRRDLKAAGKR